MINYAHIYFDNHKSVQISVEFQKENITHIYNNATMHSEQNKVPAAWNTQPHLEAALLPQKAEAELRPCDSRQPQLGLEAGERGGGGHQLGR